MILPYPANLKEELSQTEELQNSLTGNKYYYLIENGKYQKDCRLNILNHYQAAKKVSALSSCDLVLLGKNRNQMMPPHFGIKFIDEKAIVIEFICYLFDDDSIGNDVNMLIQYLQVKHNNIKQLIIPTYIQFNPGLYQITKRNGEILISWD